MKTDRILIVKLSSLGDIVQSFQALHYLKERFPHVEIDWVAEKAYSDLLVSHPYIDRVLVADTKKWRKNLFQMRKEIKEFFNTLRERTYDSVFDLQGNCKSGVITLFTKAAAKVGFDFKSVSEWPNLLATNKWIKVNPSEQISKQYLSLVQKYFNDDAVFALKPISFSTEKEEEVQLDSSFSSMPKLMICPGSNWSNKQLSENTLRDFLSSVSASINPFMLFIWKSEKEKEQALRLHSLFPQNSHVIGNLKVPIWQNLMGQMDGVITVDSSALHLAALAGVPTFSIFGPSSSSVYKPEGSIHLAYQGTCPYQKRFYKRCPILRSCSTGACIKNIEVSKLFESFSKWWERIYTRQTALQSASKSM